MGAGKPSATSHGEAKSASRDRGSCSWCGWSTSIGSGSVYSSGRGTSTYMDVGRKQLWVAEKKPVAQKKVWQFLWFGVDGRWVIHMLLNILKIRISKNRMKAHKNMKYIK